MSAGLLSVLLVVARIAPATYVLSVFGGVQLNRLARLAVIVAVSVAAWPGSIGGAAPGALDVIVRVGSQLAVGLGAAAGAVGFFELARTAGALADVSLGRGSFGAADPFGGAAGPLGTLHSLTFLAVIFASGGHCIVLAAIAAGFDAFPLDATLTEADIGALAAHAVDASGAAIALAAGLALPAIAVAWTIDLALGWLGRVLPSLPATFLAMPLKMLVGWIVVATTLAVVVDGTVSSALDAFDAALTSPHAPMSGEKTEDPTPERLRKLREKGEAPHSREVTKTAALVAAILAILATGRASTAALAALAHRCWALETDPGAALVTGLELIARAAGAPAGAAAIAAIAAGITQTGALFAPKRIAPDPSRMQPGQVWKGRLRAETLVNAGLALTAAVVTGTASALGVRRLVDVAPAIARAGADGRVGAGLAAVVDTLIVVVAIWVGSACAIAIVDAVWQRTAFMRQHRMSRQEIVDEYKQLEGDPAHRARRERAHREILATPIREGVARADVLVVNPTHIAVGLRYRPDEAGAPTVTIAGRGVDAKAIRREANRQRVPLIEDRPVARATVDLEVGSEIPDSTYEAVAIVFRWLEQQGAVHGVVAAEKPVAD